MQIPTPFRNQEGHHMASHSPQNLDGTISKVQIIIEVPKFLLLLGTARVMTWHYIAPITKMPPCQNIVKVPKFLHPVGTERVMTWHHIAPTPRCHHVKVQNKVELPTFLYFLGTDKVMTWHQRAPTTYMPPCQKFKIWLKYPHSYYHSTVVAYSLN